MNEDLSNHVNGIKLITSNLVICFIYALTYPMPTSNLYIYGESEILKGSEGEGK